MKFRITRINLFKFVWIALAVYLGVTGKVDWLILILIFLCGFEVNVEF